MHLHSGQPGSRRRHSAPSRRGSAGAWAAVLEAARAGPLVAVEAGRRHVGPTSPVRRRGVDESDVRHPGALAGRCVAVAHVDAAADPVAPEGDLAEPLSGPDLVEAAVPQPIGVKAGPLAVDVEVPTLVVMPPAELDRRPGTEPDPRLLARTALPEAAPVVATRPIVVPPEHEQPGHAAMPPPADLDDVAVRAGLVDRDLRQRVLVAAHLCRIVYREGRTDAGRSLAPPEHADQAGIAAAGAVRPGAHAQLRRQAQVRLELGGRMSHRRRIGPRGRTDRAW